MDGLFDLVCILLTLVIMLGFVHKVENNSLYSSTYFLNNIDDYEIINYQINPTRSGNNSYVITAKHLETNNYYDFDLDVNAFIKLGGFIDGLGSGDYLKYEKVEE